jgi:hypothetical protein
MNVDVTEIATQGASELFNYGILGVFCVCLMAFVVYIVRSHKEERKEWREERKIDAEKRDAEFLRANDRQAQASEKLADAIAQLSRDIHTRSN